MSAADRDAPLRSMDTPQVETCVICGLELPRVEFCSERLMASLLTWWMEGTLSEDSGPAAAMEDMKALLDHLHRDGLMVVAVDGGDAGASSVPTAGDAT